jgi:hypothetical protein
VELYLHSPNTPSWRGAQLKHRDNFTFTLLYFTLWDDNIRIDLRETGWEGVDWMHLTQDRDQWRGLVNMVMNIRVPYKVGKFLTA